MNMICQSAHNTIPRSNVGKGVHGGKCANTKLQIVFKMDEYRF